MRRSSITRVGDGKVRNELGRSREECRRRIISGMSHFGPAVSHETANDPLFRMRAYRLAADLREIAWHDAKVLSGDPVTERITGQLYAAVTSIAANLSEGYSRSSGKDRARVFEYALGSARESINWYQAARPVLGDGSRCDRKCGNCQ